jgi:Leucine-rich repeat (LRR) protein
MYAFVYVYIHNIHTFIHAYSLTTLYLNHNRLTTVQPNTTLYAYTYKHTNIRTYMHAYSLTTLYLNHNRLTTVPTEIGLLTQLIIVKLHHSPLHACIHTYIHTYIHTV